MALSFKHPSIISLEYAIFYLLGILTVITCYSTCLNYLQITYLVLPVPLIGSTKFITQHQALEKGKSVYFDVFTRGRIMAILTKFSKSQCQGPIFLYLCTISQGLL